MLMFLIRTYQKREQQKHCSPCSSPGSDGATAQQCPVGAEGPGRLAGRAAAIMERGREWLQGELCRAV